MTGTVVGRKLLDFLADEEAISADSYSDLIHDLPFFDTLIQIILDFLNRGERLLPGESKYYVLLSLCKTQTLKACACMTRHHVADAFGAMRISADAALYSLLMSMDRLSEESYLTDTKARNIAVRRLGEDVKKGTPLPSIVKAVYEVRSLHSPHAHADPISLAHRIATTKEGKIQYSNFQTMDDVDYYRYLFMGMLWVSGMCFKSFLHIQENEFIEDVSQYTERLNSWKMAIIQHRKSVVTFPERDDEGF